jgi:hypothetical protein
MSRKRAHSTSAPVHLGKLPAATGNTPETPGPHAIPGNQTKAARGSERIRRAAVIFLSLKSYIIHLKFYYSPQGRIIKI